MIYCYIWYEMIQPADMERLFRPRAVYRQPDTKKLPGIAGYITFYSNWIPCSSALFKIGSGQIEDCTSPICALRR